MLRETSLEAYRRLEASGGLSPLRLLVARDIAEHGPTTQTETTARLSAGKAQRFNNPYQPRFAELERFGVIAAVGEKACALTGRMEVAWDLTGNLPVKPPPRVTKVQAERDRCLRVAREVEARAQTEQGRRAAQEVARMIAEVSA